MISKWDATDILQWFGIAFFGLGFIALIIISDKTYGLAIISFGIACYALGESLKTDKMVTSLANLNFDEKIAIITGQKNTINLFLSQGLEVFLSPTNLNNFKDILHRFRWDFKAISRLQKYDSIDQKERDDLLEIVDEAIAKLTPLLQHPNVETNIKRDIEDIIQTRKEFINMPHILENSTPQHAINAQDIHERGIRNAGFLMGLLVGIFGNMFVNALFYSIMAQNNNKIPPDLMILFLLVPIAIILLIGCYSISDLKTTVIMRPIRKCDILFFIAFLIIVAIIVLYFIINH